MPIAPVFECLSCGGQYFEASRDGAIYVHVCGPLPVDDKGMLKERPDKRDENLAISGRGDVVGIRAEGKGVKCLTDKKLKEPTWITALKKRIATKDDDDAA